MYLAVLRDVFFWMTADSPLSFWSPPHTCGQWSTAFFSRRNADDAGRTSVPSKGRKSCRPFFCWFLSEHDRAGGCGVLP